VSAAARTGEWLKYAGIAVGVFIVALAIVFYSISANRTEQIFLVNDGLQVLRVDHCDIDGLQIAPGRYNWPIPVTAKMSCPVYRNEDAAYLGCLIFHRQSQPNRQIQILGSLRSGMSEARCDRGSNGP
jgi:hypothetical protein